MAKATKSIVTIIPYYNGSKTIEQAVQSALGQTVVPDELIVVNDGSRKEEADFLHKLAKKLKFRVIDQENGGQGAARNAGVAASKSDYVCFLDQDDFYLKNHNELLLGAIPDDDPHFGWAYGDVCEADGNGNLISTSMIKDFSKHPKTNIMEMLKGDLFILPTASIISREAYEAVGGFDPQFTGYEDDDLFVRIFRKGFTNYYLDRAVSVWCIHGESTSYSIKMAQSRFRYFKKLVESFPDEPLRDRYYLRQCLYPRFNELVAVDAYRSLLEMNPERDGVLAANKSETMRILSEFTDICLKNDNLLPRQRKRLALQKFVLLKNSRFLAKWALRAMRLARFSVRH
ncbi:glycosyltransferase family A protein [Microvirga sp. W0021]|uniref:Glycosyltransferase family A protein n=1 Tax=Hohaiivirga grylli TaxID=3133970 RepID=A0ABV0BKC8_9HYPH